MSNRVNPLHTPVSNSRSSTYSTLLGALSDHSLSLPRRQPELRIPIIPDPRNLSRLPLDEPQPPIYFDYVGHGRRRFSMTALTTLPLSALAGQMHASSEHVLADIGIERITFRIIWPGLETVEWTRLVYTRGRSGNIITRVELAVQIARSYQEFIEANQFDDTTNSDFKLGSGGIQFEQLVLVSLRNTSEDTWQAEIAVEMV